MGVNRISGWFTEDAERLEYSPVELAYKRVKASKAKLINLASGNPDPDIVPIQRLLEITIDVFNAVGYEALTYPETGGLEDLRREIKLFMSREGVELPDDYHVAVTSGAQHAFKLLSELLVDAYTGVICESPTFFETLAPLKLRAGSVVGVPFRGGRLDLEELEAGLRLVGEGRRSIIYLIPTCHNPMGFTMGEDDRRAVLEIASKYDALVIEDDPYRAFAERAPRAIVSMDYESRVIYVGTLSKILAPGLRIGWVAAPQDLVERLAMLENYDVATSTLTQHVALEALRQGLVDSTAAELREHYGEKRRALEGALEGAMPDNVDWDPGGCGLFKLIRARGFDADAALDRAIERGVIYVPARKFFVPDGDPGSMRLSLGPPTYGEIEEGVRILSGVIRDYSSSS